MTKILKSVSLISAAALSLLTAVPAMAQDNTDARFQALEAEIARLKAQVNAASSDVELIKTRPDIKKSGPAYNSGANGFKVGNTTLKLGGFVDLDVHFTKTSDGEIGTALAGAGRDQFIPSLTPVGDGSNDAGDFQLDTTVQSSRLTFGSSTPTEGGDVTTHVELDFLLSPGGNEIVSNSFNPRLRRAYVDYKGWRVGQEWTTFQGLHAIPESASFYAPAESQVFIRQAQVRYTNGPFQFAVENPESFIDLTNGLNGNSVQNEGILPDFVARYNWKGDWGLVSFSALARQLQYEAGDIEESAFGYGLSMAGRVKVGAKDDIRFTVNGGEGIGRYIGLGIVQGAQFDADNEDLEAIGAISANAAYRHVMGPWSANVGASWIDIDLDSSVAENLDETTEAYSGYVALLRKVAPGMTVGVEYLHGERKLVSGVDGKIDRFTFSTKKSF